MPTPQEVQHAFASTRRLVCDTRWHAATARVYYQARVTGRRMANPCVFCAQSITVGQRGLYIFFERAGGREITQCHASCLALNRASLQFEWWQDGAVSAVSAVSQAVSNTVIVRVRRQTAPPAAPPSVGQVGIRLGADPELQLLQNGRTVSARSNGLSSVTAQLGCDGAGTPIELRPSPGDPNQVTANIARLLARLDSFLAARPDAGAYRVQAGAGVGLPIGGHIHFSGVASSVGLVSALDALVSRHLNSVCMPASVRSRNGAGYGVYGATRRQPHGWEYRTPPSWLSTPVVTLGTLAASWVLAHWPQEHGDEPYPRTLVALLAASGERWREPLSVLQDDLARRSRDYDWLERDDVLAAWRAGAVVPVVGAGSEADPLVPDVPAVPAGRYRILHDNNYACEEIVAGFDVPVEGVRLHGMARGRVAELRVWFNDYTWPHVALNAFRATCGRLGVLYERMDDRRDWDWSFVRGDVPAIAMSRSLRENVPAARAVLEAFVRDMDAARDHIVAAAAVR